MKYVLAISWVIALLALLALPTRVPALQVILDQRSLAEKERD